MTRRTTTFLGLVMLALGCNSSEPTEPRLEYVEISITRAAASLLVNDTALVKVRGFSQIGVTYPLLGPPRWRSSNTAVAVVNDTGLVEGRAPGSTLIIVAVDGKSDSLPLTVAGTLHSLAVTASATWTVVDAPHVVRGRVSVGGPAGAILTVEAGATVLFEGNAGVTFGQGGSGSLVAAGTAAAPILFAGTGAVLPGAWIGLTFLGQTAPELRAVTLRGCGGGRSDQRPLGCIVVGEALPGADPSILIDNVTIESGTGTGLTLLGDARFAPGSAILTARDIAGHVATFPATQMTLFPRGGAFANNATNEIWLTADTVAASQAWPDPGLPSVVLEPVLIEGPQSPVLAIPAGLTLRFRFGAGFVVGKDGPGALAIGETGGAPVTLASGDSAGWAGIVFWPQALPSTIRSTALDLCGSDNNTGYGQGCIFFIGDFAGQAPEAVLQDVAISRAIDVGVGLVGGGRFGAGSGNLVITGTGGTIGVPISVNGSDVTTVPQGRYTGNALDRIWIYTTSLTADETWHDRGVPYHLYAGFVVEDAADPVLTLEPGVVLEFAPGGSLRVGGLAPGTLRAVGTASALITFAGQFAGAGTWMGVDIGPYADAATLIEHATVNDAGADDGQVAAAIRMAKDLGPIVRNTLLSNSAGCGITRLGTDPWTTDFTAPALGNTFQNIAGAAQCGP